MVGKLPFFVATLCIVAVSIQCAHLGHQRLARSASDSGSESSSVSNDDPQMPGGGGGSDSNSNSDEDSVSQEEMNCVMTQTCNLDPNVLATQPGFGPITGVLATLDIELVRSSTITLINQANAVLTQPINPGALNCFQRFESDNAPLLIESQFNFSVVITNEDGTFPAPPTIPLTNINVSVIFMDLLSFGSLQVDFFIDSAGAVQDREDFFLATTLNNGAVTLPMPQAFPLTFGATVSITMCSLLSELP